MPKSRAARQEKSHETRKQLLFKTLIYQNIAIFSIYSLDMMAQKVFGRKLLKQYC